ncbi:MAG: matrixin family metalloprotease [Myxococcota bacterium]
MNRKLLFVSAAVAVVAGSIASTTSAQAFVLLTPNRVWDLLPVNVDINRAQVETSITDGDHGEADIIDALEDQVKGWDGKSGVNLINATAHNNAAAVNGDGKPTIEFNDPLNICTGGCLAATLTGFFHATAGFDTIDDADIYVTQQVKFTSENEDPNVNTCGANEFYISGILQHEVGHVLGLGHSNNQAATMFFAVNPCDIGEDELANDDANGINSLY